MTPETLADNKGMPDEIWAFRDGRWIVPTTPMAAICLKYTRSDLAAQPFADLVEALKEVRDLASGLDKREKLIREAASNGLKKAGIK